VNELGPSDPSNEIPVLFPQPTTGEHYAISISIVS
jgi:hypothetical protein